MFVPAYKHVCPSVCVCLQTGMYTCYTRICVHTHIYTQHMCTCLHTYSFMCARLPIMLMCVCAMFMFVHVLYLYTCLHALCLCACAESSKLKGRVQLGRHCFYRSLMFKQKVLLEMSVCLFPLPSSRSEPGSLVRTTLSFPRPRTAQSQALVIFSDEPKHKTWTLKKK